MEIFLKKGSELSIDELAQIKDAIFREFKVPFQIADQSPDRLFFLLKQENKILSMGALWEVKPVSFEGEEFSFFGVLNVVANEKGKGHGRQVVEAMRKYALAHNKTAFGFCMPKNKGFYAKCGFQIEENSTQRFVYAKGTERITNKDGQIIFYQESSDNFMKKVLAQPEKEVSIPTEKLW
ncbi:GNAT family N-acetyltransferase [Candidatus Roizmanbacteria bacterium]|nr:GNAT family N-acetyltransferase [Candidatus Roizmanbacteria bacterium]